MAREALALDLTSARDPTAHWGRHAVPDTGNEKKRNRGQSRGGVERLQCFQGPPFSWEKTLVDAIERNSSTQIDSMVDVFWGAAGSQHLCHSLKLSSPFPLANMFFLETVDIYIILNSGY